jgi:hypothetical protein
LAEFPNLEETASVIRVWDHDSGKEVAELKPADPSSLFHPAVMKQH